MIKMTMKNELIDEEYYIINGELLTRKEIDEKMHEACEELVRMGIAGKTEDGKYYDKKYEQDINNIIQYGE
jgi:hypothetical protein